MIRYSAIYQNLTLFLIAIVFTWGCTEKSEPVKQPSKAVSTSLFSPKLEAILEKRISSLKEFLDSPLILDTVISASSKHKDASAEQIEQWDQEWRNAEENDPLVQNLLSNPCALALQTFQGTSKKFSEIFITDSVGLNACQTNRTSDYYQADEQWWKDSFANGEGKTYFGQVEYDESAGVEAIPIYIPIYATNQKKVVGICKGVVDLTEIKKEYNLVN